jgi:uncharacterized protein (UPF0276 family)
MGAAPTGVGIGLRQELFEALLGTTETIPWLEFVPENYFAAEGFRRRALEQCKERWPLVPHGVALSIGGPAPLDFEYLRQLKALLRAVSAPYFSDHLCFSNAHGIEFHDLLPLPFTEAAAHHAAERARVAADFVELPLLLENITYYAEMPGSQLSEGEFMRRVLEQSGAHLLLDLNNVYVNAKNHGRSPEQVLSELPLERTRQIHLAGHVREGARLLDNHGGPVCDQVWELYRQVTLSHGSVPTLVEWDTAVPELARVLEEAAHATRIAQNPEPGWTRS